MKIDKKTFIAVWVLVVLAVIVLLTWAFVQHAELNPAALYTAPTSTAPTTGQANGIQQYQNGQLAPGISQDMILASDAQILNSYSGLTLQGKQQSTVVYSTSQSGSRIFAAYLQYLPANNWNISSIAGLTGPQSISATSPNAQISIVISPATTTATVAVTIIK